MDKSWRGAGQEGRAHSTCHSVVRTVAGLGAGNPVSVAELRACILVAHPASSEWRYAPGWRPAGRWCCPLRTESYTCDFP